MGDTSSRIIFITASSEEEAGKIAKTLVAEKLAACVNSIPGVKSTYWWEGKVCQEDEVMLIAKTTSALFPAVMNRVKLLHSYEVPEIISFPIAEGLPDYLRWIEEVTQ